MVEGTRNLVEVVCNFIQLNGNDVFWIFLDGNPKVEVVGIDDVEINVAMFDVHLDDHVISDDRMV